MEPITDIVAQELKCLPAEFLADLPTPQVFVAYHAGLDAEVVFVTQELAEPRDGWPALTLDGLEIQAVITGLRCERFDGDAFFELCSKKFSDARARITLKDTLGDVQPIASDHLSCTELFRLLRLVLVSHGSWRDDYATPMNFAKAA